MKAKRENNIVSGFLFLREQDLLFHFLYHLQSLLDGVVKYGESASYYLQIKKSLSQS